MIQYSEALEILNAVAKGRKIAAVDVTLEESFGLVLARDLKSPEAVPSFDNSAMDGFALRSIETRAAKREAPVELEVIECVVAGDSGETTDAPMGACHEIMTGAPIPGTSRPPFDAVVKIEDVEVLRDALGKARRIRVHAPVEGRAHVRGKGEDFGSGAIVGRAGETVAASDLLALASLGISRVPVRRRPRIAVLSTGRELVHHAEKGLRLGMIRNSTAPYLMALLSRIGCDPKFYGLIRDDVAQFKKVIHQIRDDGVDVVLSTGAVSMGIYDFVKAALLEEDARIHFHKAAIRPGKPILFGELADGPAFFGVPGNPVSTMVGLRFFVLPFLRAALGQAPERTYSMRLRDRAAKPDGLRCFYKAVAELPSTLEGGASVCVLPGQASFMVSPLLVANAWAILTEEGDSVSRGTRVEVVPLLPEEKPWLARTREARDRNETKPGGCCV